MSFQDKRLLLGVTGGIAAYKAAELARRLAAAGAQVKVVMTASAQQFVGPATFGAITGQPVSVSLWGDKVNPLEHVFLGQQVDAIVIAPATANFIGKLAGGIGDDLLSTIMLAATRPVLVCPAMNCEMWANPVVQENVAKLAARGLEIMNPAEGELACGAAGFGRLPEPEAIVEALARLVSPQDLAGRRVLVTAGPTHEDLDPVRFLTNRSSGKMGYALARMAWRRGASVTLVSGPTALPDPYGAERVRVRSAQEMLQEVRERFLDTDALLMAAAVSDYRAEKLSEKKIKRGAEMQQVKLVQNLDILKEVGKLKKHQVVVGFAAETGNLVAEAERKLKEKNLDLIVANDVNQPDSGFAVDTNEVTLVSREEPPRKLPLLTKEEVADKILDWVAPRLAGKPGGTVLV
jgi:phosphopantothenoylcysteine decarboxylase/phosphopantothenate--cysteine ligase|uniref:Coenzyme A biosynthesis bifunctional protein CoaBC n=1 Tax=Desulfobacca acetoxidans TaxID=60893 RepID=A0A7C3V451_9BACT